MEDLYQNLSDEFHYDPHISSLISLETREEEAVAAAAAAEEEAASFLSVYCSSPFQQRGIGQPAQTAYHWQRSSLLTYEALTAVTMKNVVFWDIKTQLVPHRRHITSPLQSPAS
jgi:hypothetical protein